MKPNSIARHFASPNSHRSGLILAFSLVFFCLSHTPRTASAFGDSGQLWIGPSLGNLNSLQGGSNWGVGFQIGAQLNINDFWRMVGGLEGSYHFSDEAREVSAHTVTGAFLGARYALDIFQYVPYLGLALTAYPTRPPAEPTDSGFAAGAKLTVGVDWRVNRTWSLGALADLHMVLTDPSAFPVYSIINLNLSYHFLFF